MALPSLHHAGNETEVSAFTPSIGTSPQVAEIRVPHSGRITKVGIVTGGAISGSNCLVSVAVNGTVVPMSGSLGLVASVAGAAAGQAFVANPTSVALSVVREDDVISFTPSNASGANISATMSAMIKRC
jgi:hypothetical protein